MKVRLNPQMIIAGVVVFALGAGSGFFVEHERLKNKTHTAAAASTTTPSTATAAWFAQPAAACPALKSWETAALASFAALAKKAPWPTTQAALVAQTTASTAAMKTLLPLATPTGRARLTLLITRQNQTSAALKHATSLVGYQKTARPLNGPRVKSGNAILTRAATACAKT